MATRRAEQCLPVTSGKRHIFHPGIGRDLANLRELKHLSQGQVALRGKGRISKGTLKAIETGRVKNPDPDHLRALAGIYGVPFNVVAEPFVRANYGPDLVRQSEDQESQLPLKGQAHDPVAARLFQLESENKELRSALEKITRVAHKLVQIAKVGEQGDSVADTRPARRRRHRETG